MFLFILFSHWIADFVCQTDWQAKNKSSNNEALSSHVAIYSMIMTFFYIVFSLCFPFNFILINALYFLFITFITHFATDYLTSRLNTFLWNKGDVHNFFVSVGFDQFIHACTLYGTIILLGGKL